MIRMPNWNILIFNKTFFLKLLCTSSESYMGSDPIILKCLGGTFFVSKGFQPHPPLWFSCFLVVKYLFVMRCLFAFAFADYFTTII